MQDINVISHSMLVDRDEQGNAFTTSLVIADGTGVQHKNVLEMVKSNIGDFEEFGGVAFQTRPFETAGGVQERKVALLNREQATLLMTYMRNNDVVRGFKKRLVRAFSEMEKRLSAPALSGPELVARALIEAQNMLEEKDHQIKELAPKALFADAVAASEGSMLIREFAKELCQNGYETGERRLYEWFRNNGYLISANSSDRNRPTQYSVERGWFEVTEHVVQAAGRDPFVSPVTRITGKGRQYFMKKLLGGANDEA